MTDTPLLPDTIIDDRYRLLSELGGGASGIVYLAEDIQLQRQVAVKLVNLPLEGGEEMFTRLQREARALYVAAHPNIVHVLRIGRHGVNQIYLAMEYVPGASLQAVLSRGPLTFAEVHSLSAQICRALHHAEKQGVVHRDVKPQNVLITQDSPDSPRLAKLADFGLCKLSEDISAEANLTRTGVTLGTPQYMSPEQCYGQPVDARSDIYSFGCTMFEMLSGRPPFVAATPALMLMKHITEVPPKLLALAPKSGMPEQLQTIYLKCLSKRPEDRYQSFAEVQEALDEVGPIAGEQKLAITDTNAVSDQNERPIGSRRPAVMLAAGFAVVVLAGVLFFFGGGPSLVGPAIVNCAELVNPQDPIPFVENSLGAITTIRGADVGKEVAEDTMVAADAQHWSKERKLSLAVAHFNFFRNRRLNTQAAVFAQRALLYCLDDLGPAARQSEADLIKDREYVAVPRVHDISPQQQKVMITMLQFFLDTDLPRESWSSLSHRIGGYNATLSPRELKFLPYSEHTMMYGSVAVKATELSSEVISRETAQRLQDFYFVSAFHADMLDREAAFANYVKQMLKWTAISHDRHGEISAHFLIADRALRKHRMDVVIKEKKIMDELRRKYSLPESADWRLDIPAAGKPGG